MILEFLFAALLIELTPGPNMTYLALLAANQGRRAGFAAALGVGLGLSAYAALAAFGLGSILAHNPLLLRVLRAAGAGYLVYLAWEAWAPTRENSPGLAPMGVPNSFWHSPFWRGLITNLFNAKAAVFYTLLLPRFMETGAAPYWLQGLRLGATHIAVATAVHATIILGAAQAHGFVSAAADRAPVRAAFAAALIATAFWLATG